MSDVLKSWALFLDLDGTLVDIASAPGRIVVPRELPLLLARLSVGLGGALAVISGRTLREIDVMLAPLKPVAAGVHGAERRTVPCGEVKSLATPLDPDIVERVKMIGLLDPGIVIESKLYSIAVHYRLAESARGRIEAALKEIVEESPDHLILSPGRKVIEVVPNQISKGSALADLMQEPQFRHRTPVMIGDDYSDQSAFDVALALGGIRQRVAGEHFSGDEAEFKSPAHVRAWLASLCQLAGV